MPYMHMYGHHPGMLPAPYQPHPGLPAGWPGAGYSVQHLAMPGQISAAALAAAGAAHSSTTAPGNAAVMCDHKGPGVTGADIAGLMYMLISSDCVQAHVFDSIT
jgi:hypothetical protein